MMEWLTGFDEQSLQQHIEDKTTFEQFFLSSNYLFVGWIGLPGVAYVILRRSRTEFLCVLCGVGGISFTAIAILTARNRDRAREGWSGGDGTGGRVSR